MSQIIIYLAGKVPKGAEIGSLPDWRESYSKALQSVPGIEVMTPENPELDESRPMTIMGHDCSLVRSADLIVVNASTKIGVGTAQEMVIAKLWNKPVLTVLPRDSHHRRTNLLMHGRLIPDWVHPFVFGFSDRIFGSESELAPFLCSEEATAVLDSPKSIDVIDTAIAEYEDWLGDQDQPHPSGSDGTGE